MGDGSEYDKEFWGDDDTQVSECCGLLAAETELAALSKRLADEYQQYGKNWPKAWVEKHVKARKALIDARNVILDVIGS